MAEKNPRKGLVAALLAACVCGLALAAPARGLTERIADVRLSNTSFNPSSGQQVELTYRLEKRERISVHVYDPDDGLVRTLVDSQERTAGEHVEVWDGTDLDGRVVPDEAYYFVIETASGALYDPRTFSGGEVGDVIEVEVDRAAGTIVYRLPTSARVLCRLGIHNGPMLKTLVDWKPRVAGLITEYWQGWDEDGVVEFSSHPEFSGILTYVALPETSVIAFGNREATYREIKLGSGSGRPLKPQRPRVAQDGDRLRPEGLVPPAWARAPEVKLTLLGMAAGTEVPEVGDEVRVRVEIDPADQERLQNDQFEIMFFVDNLFFAEAERGYTPFNWVWETHQLPPGEHVLTVNVASFGGQVGAASVKVRVRAD